MSIPHFFIDRPRFAVVISIVIVLLGVIAFPESASGAISGGGSADRRGAGKLPRSDA